jgi:hypothetical protein
MFSHFAIVNGGFRAEAASPPGPLLLVNSFGSMTATAWLLKHHAFASHKTSRRAFSDIIGIFEESATSTTLGNGTRSIFGNRGRTKSLLEHFGSPVTYDAPHERHAKNPI